MSKEVPAFLAELGEQDGVSLMTYSGRGMYGEECLAYSLGSIMNFMQPFVNMLLGLKDAVETTDQLEHGMQLITEMMQDSQIDQLGRGHVVYCPHFKPMSAPESDE